MKCPICNSPMVRQIRANFSLKHCEQCQGHLVDYDRLATIKRSKERDVQALMQEVGEAPGIDSLQRVRCPQCHEVMRKKRLPPPADFCIDICQPCNLVWLDGGELASYTLHYQISEQAQEAEEMRRRHEQMSPHDREEFQKNLDRMSRGGLDSLGGMV
ncbi:MAG: zf-TFIIB domain-containing protein [Pirellulaceae bacterium]